MADSFPALFWGYTALWAVLAIYIWTLGSRVSRLERSVTEVKGGVDGSAIGSKH